MTEIAFFGHNASDPAVRRRVQSFHDDGLKVSGFTMRRGEPQDIAWENVDLGQTRDGALLARIGSIFKGARLAAQHKAQLASADVIYARNLDMLCCAFLAKRHTKLKTPVIYECLDVHRMLTRGDIIGKLGRWLEGTLLKRTIGLVVSSPGFLKHHFEKHFAGNYTAILVENRLAAGADYGARPDLEQAVARDVSKPLRIGWIGILRCQRSLDLLCKVADDLGDRVEIRLHGIPARNEIPVFEPEIDKRKNVSYFGRYKSPEDLASIYGELDVVWAGDFMEAGYNSVWLLPNRIYEGGYYATPAVAPQGTQTAIWLADHDCGTEAAEPLEETLSELFGRYADDRRELTRYASKQIALSDDVFIQPIGFMKDVIEPLLQRQDAS